MCSNLPPSKPSGHNVFGLLALIRRPALNSSVAPADALIDIRDAIREYDGELEDQE